MAEILPIRRKILSNQSINQSINQLLHQRRSGKSLYQYIIVIYQILVSGYILLWEFPDWQKILHTCRSIYYKVHMKLFHLEITTCTLHNTIVKLWKNNTECNHFFCFVTSSYEGGAPVSFECWWALVAVWGGYTSCPRGYGYAVGALGWVYVWTCWGSALYPCVG